MSQFPLVGQAYAAPAQLQDAQVCVNWYLEVSQDGESKTPTALLGTPGLQTLLTVGPGPIRGMWVLPGGAAALVASGNEVHYVTAAASIQSMFPALQTTKIGTLDSSAGAVCIRDNGAGGIAVIACGADGYVVNIAARTVSRIVDTAWLGSTRVVFVDGWLVFNKPGSQTFYTSPLYWNGTDPLDATYFALKDVSTDNLITMYEHRREIWMIGERTTEVWVDAGGATFPFGRLQGAVMQHGCAAANSIARVGDSLMWLARDEQGQNIVAISKGLEIGMASTIAINHAIASYAVISDAIGYAYQEDGHTFYVLTFPSADVTWVYDGQTGAWHQRAAFAAATGAFHRHIGNAFMDFLGARIIGDFSSGRLFAMSRLLYTDDGAPLVAWRRCPHSWDKDNRSRLFHSQLQIDMLGGVGLQTGQGSDPQILVRWSDDGAQTWSNERRIPIGKAGITRNRAITRRLGSSRDRVYDIRISDPVPRDIVGASLMLEGSISA